MGSKIYCSCGKLLQITVSREGAQLRCPEHGIVWRFVVEKPKPERGRKDSNHT